jgi:UDP:flavonoid glycosyltransferase YjiC (YdhE family)
MRRKTIYAAMTGGFGALAQVLPILECLDPAEYRIVCSISHGAADAVKRLGYEFIQYPNVGVPDPTLVTPKGRQWLDLDQYWGRFGFADASYLGAVVESRLEIVRELKPDLLVTHFCPPTEIIARITGIPLVCVTQSCWHPRGKPISWWGRAEGQDYVRVTPAVNTVLARHGAIAVSRVEDLNQGDLTFIPSFPEFDPIDDPAVHYMGPSVWSSSARLAPESEVGRERSTTRPLVVAYTGHLIDSGGRSGILILESIARALAGLELDVIATTGLGQRGESLLAVAPNIQIHDWIDIPRLLQQSAAFIHHGGHGSCMAAIIAGVTSVVIPTFQEREFNARQLHELGLGVFLPPDSSSPMDLRDALLTQLRDAATPRNLRFWQEELGRRAYGGGRRAAELVRQELLH